MNTILKGLIITLSLPFAIVGCGTTPASTFYLLNAEASPFPSGSSPSLGVGPIEIPQYLNRNAIVYSREENRLHIAAFERWAEPLDNGIGRVLSLNLASLLDTKDVQSYPWTKSNTPTYAVEVTVLSLDANDKSATLVAQWHLYKAKNRETVMRRVTKLDEALTTSPVSVGDIAPAYSRLLLQLSEVIAKEISKNQTH